MNVEIGTEAAKFREKDVFRSVVKIDAWRGLLR